MPTKYTIEDMRELAARRNGNCLSTSYADAHSKLMWECSKGHEWEATPDHVRQGKWCPFCAGKRQSIEDWHRIAERRGGKCLSKKYLGVKVKLVWECAKGHRWEAQPSNVKSGTWCPICAGKKKLTIADMRQIAQVRGGRCLSETYVDGKTKLLWECAKGHQWEAIPISVKNKGSWCPVCAGLVKGTIAEMAKMAEDRGGKCLSGFYIDNKSKLLWKCSLGHRWHAAPIKIKSGQWCPTCSAGLGERICREFFEQLFGEKFPKSRPNWLVNSRGNRMELDGYSAKLKIAFEHHGQQHYKSKTEFIRTRKELITRQLDDKMKRKLCKARNIKLLEIPEVPTLLEIDEIKGYIKRQCIRHNITLSPHFDSVKVALRDAYVNSRLRQGLEELCLLARQRGGKCLSGTYVHSHRKLLWECAKGHRWEATPTNIRTGTWCPVCVGKAKLTLEKLKKMAESRGGKCLSNTYVDNKSKLLWECVKGHRWESNAHNITAGNWCPICARVVKLTIEEMRRIALSRGGKCLSNEYVNINTKLAWECEKRHRWKATPGKIKQGKWCPTCAGKLLTIVDMRRIAESRGGKCLSDRYVGTMTKLLWECSEGHQWTAIPSNVKQGSWCPICRHREGIEKRERKRKEAKMSFVTSVNSQKDEFHPEVE